MRKLIAIWILVWSVLAIITLVHSKTETGKEYPRTFVVDSLDYENNEVIVIDSVGMEWSFVGINDWEVDDLVAAIMNDNGTKDIRDDYFVDIRFSGYVHPAW